MKRYFNLAGMLIILLFCCCEKQETTNEEIAIETPDWTETTHSSAVGPDYTTVFQQDKVKRLDIVIGSTNWSAIQTDLAGMPRSGPGQPLDGTFDPIWVSCDFMFNGTQWYKVGIRVKGNSSLRTTYQMGLKKFSFKLDFDQFENTYPAINNQRFYGFKQLNLNNNFEDQSLMREKVAGDLFREFGVPAAKSAWYEVYIDIGSGPQYFGLYTLVEEVDDTVINTQFTDGTGNVYKPEGNGASFATGSYTTADYYKKTNVSAADYTDIKAFYDAINNGLRTTDPLAWRALMETRINMNTYLKWLAANTVMQNWDTYGRMTHNYYLYNDPTQAKFVWIPWDNNESLQDGKSGGAINMDLSGVSSQWPMISYIKSDEVYYAQYKQFAKEFATTVFAPDKMVATYDNYVSLIRTSASKEVTGYTFLSSGITGFDSSVDQLKQQVSSRNELAIKLD
jgi:spore coat protein CotH